VALRASPTTSYLASYSNMDREKVGERIVPSDEQITVLFHAEAEPPLGCARAAALGPCDRAPLP
jgi:hypothetical protein